MSETSKPTWRGPRYRSLAGYTEQVSVTAGDQLDLKISSEREFELELVRLRHGAEDGPGIKETPVESTVSGRYPARIQTLRTGSFMRANGVTRDLKISSFTCHAWVKPTLVISEFSAVIAKWAIDEWAGFALGLGASGELELWLGSGATKESVCSGVVVPAGQWTFVAASVDLESGEALLVQIPAGGANSVEEIATHSQAIDCRRLRVDSNPVTVAAIENGSSISSQFDGKIEAPTLIQRSLSLDELRSQSRDPVNPDIVNDLIGAWDFSEGIDTLRVADKSGNQLDGTLVNMPARAVTGTKWTGHELDWTKAPEQYAAIHFHSDDLEDARWDTVVSVPIDGAFGSGVYAARLSDGEYEERIPFIVRPSKKSTRAPLLVLLPTLTYLAYANCQVFADESSKIRQAEDEYAAYHGLRGLYDRHRDGSPVYYSSRLMPSTTRPNYYAPNLNAPARLSSDLCLIDWLIHEGIEHDVISDHDFHREGHAALDPYRAVITGSHPEYWTEPMMVGLDEYVERGGNVIYLGGNGAYWVTSIHPSNPDVMEVRRDSGTRTQSAEPGEHYQSSTGECGGLWRYRNRPPQSRFGVGMTAWGADTAAGYRRTPDSSDPRASFVFDGVSDDGPFGEFGLVLGGAAGYEIDRLDFDLGTPPQTLLLATSAGLHQEDYFPTIEEVSDLSQAASSREALVRADMVFFETGHGGGVFSTGSIAWSGSLSHDGYANDVATITRNVIDRFTSGEPFSEG